MRLIDAYRSYIEWRGLKRKKNTVNGDISHLAHFCLYIRDLDFPVESIGLKDCIDWLNLFRKLSFDENTTIKKALALKMLFEFLKNRNVQVLNPELIPVPRREFKFPRVGEEWEYRKLLTAIPKEHVRHKGFMIYNHIRNEAIIKLLWESGARNGEITSLEMEDIDVTSMTARIKTEKSRGNVPFREIFWKAEANDALIKWLETREKLVKQIELENPDILFFGIKGGHKNCPSKGKKLAVNFVSEILRKYSNKAGLPIHLNPHAARHHFGRELAKKDTDAYGIASLMGHANVQSSFIYTMLFGKDREELYRRKFGNGTVDNDLQMLAKAGNILEYEQKKEEKNGKASPY